MPDEDEDERQPQIFFSHAWDDGPQAKRFVTDVERHGPRGFIDTRDIPPGVNVVAAIEQAFRESDYFVLLWSSAAQHREWVRREWTTALARGIREQRAFLFVVRLDETQPPWLLTPDRYLDAFVNWDKAVEDLVEAWRQDRALEDPVLPAPELPTTDVTWRDGRVAVLHVHNRVWNVFHLVTAPVGWTARELMDDVTVRLALPDEVDFYGRVGMRFTYRLMLAGEPMPKDDTLTALGISTYAKVDLEISKTEFGSDGTPTTVVYRDGAETGLPAPMVEKLVSKAFGHLKPRRKSR